MNMHLRPLKVNLKLKTDTVLEMILILVAQSTVKEIAYLGIVLTYIQDWLSSDIYSYRYEIQSTLA